MCRTDLGVARRRDFRSTAARLGGQQFPRPEVLSLEQPCVESALARKYKGTGLGLPLAKRLIEMHGGTLAVDNVPGQGTSVTVRLPASRMLTARIARAG